MTDWLARALARFEDVPPCANSANSAISRLLKKRYPDGFEDGLVAKVVFEFDLEGAVEQKCGRAGAGDLVHLVEACPAKADLVGAIIDVEAGLHGPEGDVAVPTGLNDQGRRSAEIQMIPGGCGRKWDRFRSSHKWTCRGLFPALFVTKITSSQAAAT